MRRTITLGTAGLLALAGSGVVGATTAGAAPQSQAHANAVAEAKAVLSAAPTIATAVSVAKPPVKRLDAAATGGPYKKVVQRAKYWTVDESAKAAFATLSAITPSGYTNAGSGSTGRNGHVTLRFVAYSPDTLPVGIAYAGVSVSVVSTGKGTAAIGAYGQAVVQPKRSATEDVATSATGHVALLTAKGHHVRGNTVTGAANQQLIADFNALAVVPPEFPLPCPVERGDRRIVTFRAGSKKFVATSGFCDFVEVTLNGKSLRPLEDSSAYEQDIRADLAPKASIVVAHRSKRPTSEHVPASVHKVTLTYRTEPFNPPTTKRTVTGNRAKRLVHDFDALSVEHSGIRCDIAGGPQRTVTFRTAKHTWVVREAACTDVTVTRDGKSLPTLNASTAWDKAVAADLGI